MSIFVLSYRSVYLKKWYCFDGKLYNVYSSSEQEQEMTKWIKWLSKEESHYESSAGLHISFGESLLLTAIHFHSNNLEAITDLVSSTLGMRIRPGPLTRIKAIFTQDLFPEKVR